MVIGDISKVPAECGEIPFSYHKITIGRALMTHTALSLPLITSVTLVLVPVCARHKVEFKVVLLMVSKCEQIQIYLYINTNTWHK